MQSSVALGFRAIEEGSRKLWIMIDFTNRLFEGSLRHHKVTPHFRANRIGQVGGQAITNVPVRPKPFQQSPLFSFSLFSMIFTNLRYVR